MRQTQTRENRMQDTTYRGLLTFPGHGHEYITGTITELKDQAEDEGAPGLWIYYLNSAGVFTKGHYIFDTSKVQMVRVSGENHDKEMKRLREMGRVQV